MIDDDSNELIPFEGGDSDADASTGNNNPDDTKSVTIIQDEQGIVFLGDAGTIDRSHSSTVKPEWEKQPLHKATWKHSAGNTFLSKT